MRIPALPLFIFWLCVENIGCKMDIDELKLILYNNAIQDLEEAEIDLNNGRRQLARGQPFENVSEEQFVRMFRLTKQMTRQLIEIVTPLVEAPVRREFGLTVETKVLTALRFYGTGSYQEVTGSNLYTGLSQSSVSRSIEQITNILNRDEIFNRWVKFPRNLQEFRTLRTGFYEKVGIPGIVGCIDCTHIAIVSPQGDPEHPEHIYVNRKNFHSINCQLVCDYDLKILHVNSRFPGSTHDSFIWRQSNLSNLMERIYRRNPNDPFFLIGDSGYPLRPWLLTPLEIPPAPNTPEQRFDIAFKSARSIIERCNGVLKARFRCLLKDRTLHYHPVKASKIIKACAVLHNMCVEQGILLENMEDIIEFEGINPNIPANIQERRINPDLAQARVLQRTIINNHFNN